MTPALLLEQSAHDLQPPCKKTRIIAGLGQIFCASFIFSYSYAKNGVGMDYVIKTADKYTFWTNAMLLLTGCTNLFGYNQGINNTNHQMQATLLIAVMVLMLSMTLGKEFLGVDVGISPNGYPIDAAIVQHVPSVLIAYLGRKKLSNKNVSSVFKGSYCNTFTLIRTLFSLAYLGLNGMLHYAGYSAYDFYKKDGSINVPQMINMVFCFGVFMSPLGAVIPQKIWQIGEYAMGSLSKCMSQSQCAFFSSSPADEHLSDSLLPSVVSE